MDVEAQLIMEQYVIYHHASDYPDYEYVCRKWSIYRGRDPVPDLIPTLIPTEAGLNYLRASFEHRGLTRLPRDVNDDFTIVEVWI